MKTTRRSFGAFLMGSILATGSTARAAPLKRAAYPALARLSGLMPDKRACARLADAGIAAQLDETRLASIEARAARAVPDGSPPAALLKSLNAADFREGRTLVVGGFTLAETEAGAALLRASAT